MKLYVTPGSPYARMTRIVVLEKQLQDRVEIIAAQTRVDNSPYYRVNPSGRVPYLVLDDGVGMEESALIWDYLDQIDGRPALGLPPAVPPFEAGRLEGLARSLLDGVAVWGRELARPVNERSPSVILHETRRGERLCDLWEREIGGPLMHGPLNRVQATLACALGFEARIPEFRWRSGHPALETWYGRIAARPSFAATALPPRARPAAGA